MLLNSNIKCKTKTILMRPDTIKINLVLTQKFQSSNLLLPEFFSPKFFCEKRIPTRSDEKRT